MNPEHNVGEERTRSVMPLDLDLDYPDPMSRGLDFDMVETLGRRYRRRHISRVATVSTAGAAVLTLLACGVVASRGGGGSTSPATTEPSGQQSLTKLYPPRGVIAKLSTVTSGPNAGWSQVAWISKNDYLCFGSADLRSGKDSVSENCMPAPKELLGSDAAPAVYQPLLSTSAFQDGSILVFGFARGQVASVTVTTSFGTSVSANTVGLDGTSIRAYAAFVQTAGHTALDQSDVSHVVGNGVDGKPLAHLH